MKLPNQQLLSHKSNAKCSIISPPFQQYEKKNNTLQGFFDRWVPEEEKGKFVSFTRLGGVVGSIIIFPLAGLSNLSFLKQAHFSEPFQLSGIIINNFSWVWVFYSSAILTLVWNLWYRSVRDMICRFKGPQTSKSNLEVQWNITWLCPKICEKHYFSW